MATLVSVLVKGISASISRWRRLGNDLGSAASTGTKTSLRCADLPTVGSTPHRMKRGCLMMRNNASDREVVAIDVSHASFNVIDTQVGA